PARLAAAVTVMPRSAVSAAERFHSAARHRADDNPESCDARLVSSRWVHDDRTRPSRYHSITDRGAGSRWCSGPSGLRLRRRWTARADDTGGVMIDVLERPLVAGYLRDLDAALTGLPAAAAAELSEQLRAHLLEALPPDADEDAVTAVLAALGPAQ